MYFGHSDLDAADSCLELVGPTVAPRLELAASSWLVYISDYFLGTFHVVGLFLSPTLVVFVRGHMHDARLVLQQFPLLFFGGVSHVSWQYVPHVVHASHSFLHIKTKKVFPRNFRPKFFRRV